MGRNNAEFNPFEIPAKQPDVGPSLAVAAGMDPVKEARLKELSAKTGFELESLRGMTPEELRPIEDNPPLHIETKAMKEYFANTNRAAISQGDAGNLAVAAGLDPMKDARLKELSAKTGFDVEVLRGLTPEEMRPLESDPDEYLESNAVGLYSLNPNRPRFVRSAKGVITDCSTQMKWMEGPDKAMNWNEAQEWIKNLGDRWRTPSIAELKDLFLANSRRAGDTNSSDAKGLLYLCLDSAFQVNKRCWVWADFRDSSSAWIFSFYDGQKNWYSRDYSYWNHRAFAIRSLSTGGFGGFDEPVADRCKTTPLPSMVISSSSKGFDGF